MAKLDVAGTSVTLLDRFPASKFHSLLKALRQWDEFNMGDRTPEVEMGPYVGVVTAWTFPGDPAELKAWLELDIFTEWPPLLKAINTYLGQIFNTAMASAKN
jgi:hypothetical protein